MINCILSVFFYLYTCQRLSAILLQFYWLIDWLIMSCRDRNCSCIGILAGSAAGRRAGRHHLRPAVCRQRNLPQDQVSLHRRRLWRFQLRRTGTPWRRRRAGPSQGWLVGSAGLRHHSLKYFDFAGVGDREAGGHVPPIFRKKIFFRANVM